MRVSPGAVLAMALALLVALAAPSARAQATDPILALSSAGAVKELPLSELRRLTPVEIKTATPWTEGVQTFLGFSGRALLAATGVQGREVVAEAINRYRVTIPIEVFTSEKTLIAYERNGAPMGVRDKGPFWIVFPFDDDPRFLSNEYKTYAIWSLTRLEVR